MFSFKFAVLFLQIFWILFEIQIVSTKKYKCFICDGVRYGGINCESPKEQVCAPNNTDPPLYLLTWPQHPKNDWKYNEDDFHKPFDPTYVTRQLKYPTLFGCVSFEVNRRLYKYCMYQEIEFCKYYKSSDPCYQCYDSGCNTIYYSQGDKSIIPHPAMLLGIFIWNLIF